MKQSHLTVKVILMKALWQQVITVPQLEAKITFAQNQKISGVLVVSILSLELSVDWK
jgi:hypothetical protein